ncbi:MAG: L-serine ammonia-lyase, iron-sulfur-dependent, subunit alpha [Lachnospiraceae bacterium]
MEKLPCSIFNDVIGPIMRGPSSSHVAGAARIADLVRQSMRGRIVKAVVDFDINGSLAASHTGHGTDMGFACGLMDMPLSDPAVDQYERLAREAGIDIEYRILDYGAIHPGNYRMEITDETGAVRHWEAIAVGGGMIEMQRLEEFEVNICGDFYELLVICDRKEMDEQQYEKRIKELTGVSDFTLKSREAGKCLIDLKFASAIDNEIIDEVGELEGVMDVMYLEPVLPTHSSGACKVPYSTAAELLEYAEEHPMEAWEYGVCYESYRGGAVKEAVFDQMNDILKIMESAVDDGLKGTQYKDRILGAQSQKIDEAEKEGKLVPCSQLNMVIKSITAVMETKSSMGLIVAAPTCGSCGCLPGTVIGLGRAMGLSREEMVKGLFVAGLVGIFFAEEATFSAEVGGCQVECGAGSGMAAAAVIQMMGGTIKQCMDAASVALQNITGLACDPVGNRVEVPCLGKNIMGGSNAISSANMILAGYDKVIPLDETIQAIYEIGLSLPLELRCTFGGLGKTKTALEILKKTENHFQEEAK